MAFGYEFVTLDEEQKHARRALLEFYPMVAQWSALLIFALFQLSFFLSWLTSSGLESGRPRSPSFAKRDKGIWIWLKKSQQAIEKGKWWAKKPVIQNWGTRAEWIFGGIWTVWLLYLSAARTGNDYLHLTKRFGIIGASQLPLHYLLAMRSPYSPLQFLTRMSHEELKGAHQVLGRIVFLLFALHAIFYMNFFILSGFLAKRIKDKDVIFGLISIIFFSVLSTTALGVLRRWNYRVFYVSHITIANLIIIPLYIHVTHIRPYIYEVIVVNAIHLFLRGQALKTYSGTIKLLPGTNLVQARIPLRAMESALYWRPGQHVYFSRPLSKSHATPPYGQSMLQTNPFTVASIPAKDKELLLLARTLNGNTKRLAELARSFSAADSAEVPNIALNLEGPYGASTRLPDFSTFDRILLVAGGVGATFIMPIYRSIVDSGDFNHPSGPQIRCIWAVRKLAETQWAFPASDEEPAAETSSHSNAVEVFVTRPAGPNLQASESGDDIELAEDEQLLSVEEQLERPRRGMILKTNRPKISSIVDEVFAKGTRVAVLACGPVTLTEQLSASVERWVGKGHDVYWHNETFGW